MENEDKIGSNCNQVESISDYSVSNEQTQNASQPLKPASHMALAIMTTVCCCLPFGIVGIVKASQVDSLYLSKQYAAAQKSADDAKKWSVIGIAVSVVIWFAYMALYGMAFIAATAGEAY